MCRFLRTLIFVLSPLLLLGCDRNNNPTEPSEPQAAKLEVELMEIDFGTEETDRRFLIGNSGVETLAWQISSPVSWLSAEPQHGILPGDTIQTILVQVDRNQVITGVHQADLTILPSVGEDQFVTVLMEKEELEPVVVLELEDITLDEHEFQASGSFQFPYPGYLDVEFHLKSWPEDYGLELLFMQEAEFEVYRGSNNFTALWHETISEEGTYIYLTDTYWPTWDFRFVVDNTDFGWVETDFDFVNDEAVFDLTLTIYPVPEESAVGGIKTSPGSMNNVSPGENGNLPGYRE